MKKKFPKVIHYFSILVFWLYSLMQHVNGERKFVLHFQTDVFSFVADTMWLPILKEICLAMVHLTYSLPSNR